jgi:hypothetical protein
MRALFAGRYRLWLLAPLSLLAMLVNPWGWRALWQPFAYFLFWRKEPMFAQIGELMPPMWFENVWNGLPIVAVATPLLFAWRWRKRGLDRVELVMLAAFAAMATGSARFLGFLALGVVPYLGRDLDDWLGTRRLPAWTAWPAARVAGVAAVALGVGVPHWSLPDAHMGVGVEWHAYPVDACDFIERHGVRGRVFNSFELGGYLLYRFWPERDRLPFIDVHASGTPEDRLLYVYAEAEAEGWRRLQAKYPLDWVLLLRREVEGQTLHDTIEHDPRWAMVFLDDAAVIYVRRDGALARLAPLEYRELRAGREGLRALGEACGTDSARRERARLEFERAARESHANAASHSFLATIALMDGRPAEAEPHLHAALAVDPLIPRAHERLGDLALGSGRPREAIREYELEKRAQLPPPGIELRIGQAWSRLGDRAAARAAYRRALEDPSADAEARDSLAAMERSGR